MKRLIRLSALDLKKLEEDYLKMIEKENQSSLNISPEKTTYKLTDNTKNDDVKTFYAVPGNLIEYDDNQVDTNPRGGIPGPWAASLRWIGR
jgi:hypothetical protein